MKRKKKRKIILVFTILMILAFLLWSLIYYFQSNDYQLKKIGYQQSDIKEIKKLKTDQIALLIKEEEVIPVAKMMADPTFQENNFQKYITFYKKHKQLPPEEIVFTINQQLNENNLFQNENISRYVTYMKKNPKFSVGIALQIVNANLDQDDTTRTTLKELISLPYFVENRTIRYLTYNKQNKNNSLEAIVRLVNADRDYEDYTHTMKADISRKELILVNKYHDLESNYVPEDLIEVEKDQLLQKDAASAYYKMKIDAESIGVTLSLNSSYRNFKEQSDIYESYKSTYGLAYAENYAARPGFSEHQTGLALDIKNNNATWLEQNATNYGFILRYPETLESITGYHYEFWHYRYVGKKIAKEIYEKNITLEEYLAITNK